MELSVTVAQAIAIKNVMSASSTMLFARNGTDSTRVDVVSILDAKAGQLLLRWANEGDAPLVTALLAQVPGAVEVAAITG